MVNAYNQMEPRGESVVAPSMAAALAPGGDASAYDPMELVDSPEEEPEKPRADLPYMPPCVRGRFRRRKRTGASRRNGRGEEAPRRRRVLYGLSQDGEIWIQMGKIGVWLG